MKTRVLSGLIMLPLLALVFFGGKVLLAGCILVGAMGVREFYKAFENIGIKPSHVIAYIMTAILYAINIFTDKAEFYVGWCFITILVSLLYLFNVDVRKLEDSMVTMLGIFYVVFFSFHVTLTEQTGKYGILVWLIFLTAFGTDIMAYFSGYIFGKHKLCPKISPKKTIEGSVGGTLGSIILSGVFGYFFANEIFIHCIIIGALGGIVSQFGDLTASIFKRKIGVKDYGNLIPGHGGIMDRFDSVLFTAPLVYYYISLVLMR